MNNNNLCLFYVFHFKSYNLRGLTFVIEGLTARIKLNRTSFVVESGTKPNVTCESDCGDYNWKCNYEWRAEKNGRTHIYIKKNNSRIDKPLKENVTLWCFVALEYDNNIYSYSKRIKILIKGNFVHELFGINLISILHSFKNINRRKF